LKKLIILFSLTILAVPTFARSIKDTEGRGSGLFGGSIVVPSGQVKLRNNDIYLGAAPRGTLNAALTGSSLKEDGFLGKTTITLSNTPLFGVTGGAAQANGVLLYTLPAGVQFIEGSFMDLALNGATAIHNDTPDCGIGSVKGTGAVAVLGGTATFEDILTGQTATDVNGTALVASDLFGDASGNINLAAGVKSVNFSCADTWAAGGGAVTGTGTIVLFWKPIK
jgi:hypothetical protein